MSISLSRILVQSLPNTIKPVNKGHPMEIQHMVFKDKWSLFGHNFVLFFFLVWNIT